MSNEAALNDSLAALTRFLVGEQPLHETLTRVAEMAVKAIPAATFAGMTLIENGKPQTSVFTDPDAAEIDQTQYRTGRGPCLDSFRRGEVFVVPSTREDTRWPAFSETCVEHGMFSTLSLPLKIAAETNGALNVYARAENAFGADEISMGSRFADHAAIVLTNASAYWAAFTRAQQLETAMSTRGVIEQAKGIIMAAMHCDADEAFQLLVRQSQQQNVKLNAIAEGIVAATSRRRDVPPPKPA